VALIQAQGMSLPLTVDKRKVRDAMPFFSEFLLIELCLWLVMFGAIVTLATLLPAAMGVPPDPLAPTPKGIRPEWYFLFMFQTLKYVPEAVGVTLLALGAAFLLAIPLLDRNALRERKSPAFTALFVLMVCYVAVFEIMALASTPGGHAPAPATAAGASVAADLVSLSLLWIVIGFLVYYLHQLRKESSRIRRLRSGSLETSTTER
jgi:quinol-cytochrome oxidoreductase complex cytochrome b subunit